jgi:FMN phosphatase YigB (HAD superfamily)
MGTLKYEAVIFDLDGTLYNKQGISIFMMIKFWKNLSLLRSMAKARKELKGIDFSSSEVFFNSFYGNIAEKSSITKDSVNNWYLNTFYSGFIDILNKRYIPRRGLDGFLHQLKQKMPIAILSDFAFINERLDAVGISKTLFNVIVSSEEFGVLKPSSRPLLQIASDLCIPAGRILVVGDRLDTDGKAAELAGMKFYHLKEAADWTKFCKLILDNI